MVVQSDLRCGGPKQLPRAHHQLRTSVLLVKQVKQGAAQLDARSTTFRCRAQCGSLFERGAGPRGVLTRLPRGRTVSTFCTVLLCLFTCLYNACSDGVPGSMCSPVDLILPSVNAMRPRVWPCSSSITGLSAAVALARTSRTGMYENRRGSDW